MQTPERYATLGPVVKVSGRVSPHILGTRSVSISGMGLIVTVQEDGGQYLKRWSLLTSFRPFIDGGSLTYCSTKISLTSHSILFYTVLFFFKLFFIFIFLSSLEARIQHSFTNGTLRI